jgi:hypothetical protein
LQSDFNPPESPDKGTESSLPSASVPTGRKRSTWIVLLGSLGGLMAALIVVVLVVLPGGKSGRPSAVAPQPSTLTVVGSLSLHDVETDLNNCVGTGGYYDIQGGTQVVITDSANTAIAVGRLMPGTQNGSDECDFAFALADVPAGKGIYGIEVSHRGKLSFNEADLRHLINLTLGND